MKHWILRPRLLSALFATSLLLSSVGCQRTPVPTASPTAQPSYKLSSVAVAASAPIRIATFNIANLSLNKLKKPEVTSTLVKIMRQYDVIAVQELDDASLKAPQAFLDAINAAGGDHYEMLASEESGLDATSGEKEQYAVYFNAKTISAMGEGRLYPDGDQNLFVREPFAAQLKVRSSGISFVVLTIHTDPDVAPKEIAALRLAADWAAGNYDGEAGVVILGDFNGGRRYVKQNQIDSIRARDLPYLWIVPDGADTTLGKEPQAHDRIVVMGEFAQRYTNRFGVDQSFNDTKISDHYPVWAEFSVH